MKDTQDTSLPMIEWEALHTERVVDSIKERGGIHPAINKITVSRDTNFNIVTELQGTSAAFGSHQPELNLKKGQSIPGIRIVGYDSSSTMIILDEVYPGDISIRGDGHIEGKALTFRATFEYSNPDPPRWLSIWCVNGPRFSSAPRLTERKHEVKIQRKRGRVLPDESEHAIEFVFPSSTLSSDYWLIKNSLFNLRFCMVQGGFGPDWSKNFEIQLMLPQAGILFENSFDNILESLSFVVGKRLTKVGKSLFSGSGYPIRELSNNPWGLDIQQECRNPEMPPVPLSDSDLDFTVAEPTISKLAESFCLVREEFSFSTAMWQFWMSKISPAEGSLVFLSMAVENVMTAWFKSTKTRTRGQYMPDAEFALLTKEPLDALKAALATAKYSDRILRRLSQANNMGVNERYELFFEEIRLPYTEFELSVIAARNRFAHGGSLSSDQYRKLMDAIRAYQTLFHRIVLTLCAHKGSYIDYSTLGFPVRAMSESMGGPDDDRKPITF